MLLRVTNKIITVYASSKIQRRSNSARFLWAVIFRLALAEIAKLVQAELVR